MDIDKLRKKVEEKLSAKRFKHVLGVEEMCVILAERNGADIEKARIAALLHDYMKETNIEVLKEMCKDVPEIKGYETLLEILHGFAGAMADLEKVKYANLLKDYTYKKDI